MINIKNISIKNFLSSNGIEPKYERAGYGMYISPFRAEQEPSFKVDYSQNLWYDHGSGDGGSIIELVMKLENCTAAEAIKRIENGNNFSFHCSDPLNTAPSPLQIVS